MILKKKKKFMILSCMAIMLMFGATMPVSAADTPSNGYPSISYGNTAWSNYYPNPIVIQNNQWNQMGYDLRYDGWDKDTFVAVNSTASVSLTTTSTSQYTISGSTEFGIKAIAKVTINGEWGESWGKSTTVTYNAQAGYTYELWSANQIKRIYWSYPNGSTYLSAKSEGSNGTYKWFFRY
ncbi:hypothetical protein D3C74_245420 [compost metagenome]